MSGAPLDRTLAALAEPNRRRIIEVLGERPRSAGEVGQAVGLSPPTVSRHLRALRESRLVEEESPPHDARLRIYRLTPAPMAELRAWLAETEQLWADQLSAFKAHLEGEGG